MEGRGSGGPGPFLSGNVAEKAGRPPRRFGERRFGELANRDRFV